MHGIDVQVVQLPGDFAGKVKVKAWITKLHNMPASKELEETDVRQLLFELESSYNDFMGFLNIGGRS
jgi:ESCRT-I complex subunit VPS28